MRISAALVVFGLAMCMVQVGFGGGGWPGLARLPIGIVPVTVGVVALALGLLVGLVAGNRLYRLASLVAMLGTCLVVFGITFITTGGPAGSRPRGPSIQEIAIWAGGALWIVALRMGASALHQPREVERGA